MHYHYVFDDEHESFDRQLEYLAGAFEVVSLSDAVERLRTRRVGGRELVVTFDDGFRNQLRAGRVLNGRGIRACFFLVTELVSADPHRAAEICRERLHLPRRVEPLTWEDVVELSELGHEIGSHTRTHPSLAELEPAAVDEELRSSRSELQQRLGRPVVHLSAPYATVHASLHAWPPPPMRPATRAVRRRYEEGTSQGTTSSRSGDIISRPAGPCATSGTSSAARERRGAHSEPPRPRVTVSRARLGRRPGSAARRGQSRRPHGSPRREGSQAPPDRPDSAPRRNRTSQGDARAALGVPDLRELDVAVTRVPTLNGEEARDALRRLDTEIAVSLDNTLIEKATFTLPTRGAINVHHGAVPAYRGGPPVFWELADGLNRVGFVVHQIDEGVDTGRVLAEGDVPIVRRRTLRATLAATIPALHEASLDALEQVLSALAGTGRGLRSARSQAAGVCGRPRPWATTSASVASSRATRSRDRQGCGRRLAESSAAHETEGVSCVGRDPGVRWRTGVPLRRRNPGAAPRRARSDSARLPGGPRADRPRQRVRAGGPSKATRSTRMSRS